MGLRAWHKLLAMLAALPVGGLPAHAAQDGATIRPGIYGNVRMSRATGDLGGLEIEIHPDGRTIEMTLCEGWCNHIVRSSYRSDGRAIEADYREAETGFVMRLRMTAQGKDLIVEQQVVQPGAVLPIERSRLKRLKSPFGLDLARQGMREGGAEARPTGN